MKRAVVLSHASIAFELGHLGDWLTGHGFTIVRRYREDSPDLLAADLLDADLLVLLGSPGSVAEGHSSPDGEHEIEQVRRWVEADRAVLGICYGAQVLARAAGGKVDRMAATDRGWMTLASDGDDTGDLTGPWMVWHEDAVTAPEQATVRARSGCADQIFSWRRAWGLQFHPELESGSLERMACALGASPEEYAPLVTAMREDETGHRDRTLRLLDAFWADVDGASPDADGRTQP